MTAIPYLFTGKTPAERRSFAFDFANAQEFHRVGATPAQTISTYTVTCDDGALQIEQPILTGRANNPTVVSAYIGGGVIGTYTVTFEVITNTGAIIQRSVLLPVANL